MTNDDIQIAESAINSGDFFIFRSGSLPQRINTIYKSIEGILESDVVEGK